MRPSLPGAIGALAMPPFGFLPALMASLVPAIWLLDGAERGNRRQTLKAAAIVGWLWGFGYFVAGLWWLGAAFLVEADQFAWAMPLGVVGLPALLAFFPAFGFALARLFWTGDSTRILAFAAAMTIAEWLRGHLFTGFPWNSPGMALGQNIWLMQSASVVGLYGLTLIALALGSAPAVILTGSSRRQRWTAPITALVVLVALAGFGAWRIPNSPTAEVENVSLRIMQPNLPQDAKFNPRNRDAIMQRYLAISRYAGANRPDAGYGHAPHLARIGLPVPASSRSGLAGADRRHPAARHDPHHRGCPDGRAASRANPSASSSTPSRPSIIRARSSNPTTKFTWCRSANTCRNFSII